MTNQQNSTPRIKSIAFDDFKSYQRGGDLAISPLTFLVGANASGKSNALEAIRFLSCLAKGTRLDDITRRIEGTENLVRGHANDLFRHGTDSFEISVEFEAMPQGWDFFELKISFIDDELVLTGEAVYNDITTKVPLYWIVDPPSKHTDEIKVQYNNFAQGGNKPRISCSSRMAIFYQLNSAARFEEKHENSQELIPQVTQAIRKVLAAIEFLDPSPENMRRFQASGKARLSEDGSNVSAVLHRLCKKDSVKAEVLKFVQFLPEQNITDVEFVETETREVMVKLIESFGGEQRSVHAALLSDGTLRVLAIAALLLDAATGSLVVIEEIDNGVHPSRAASLVHQIRAICLQRGIQVLLSTHNPALMDSVPDADLEDVVCCYRDPDGGDSHLVRIGDLDLYSELVAQGSLGELVTRNLVERYLKDKTSKEERTAKSLQWLDDLRAETSE